MPRSLALRCHRLADDLAGVSLDELDPVRPAAGQVMVSMRAAALNFPDLLMTRGGYQHQPALPFTIGMEGAGTVEAVGEGVTGWRVGDAVCVSEKSGAIAHYALYPASALSALPLGWDWPSAAAWQVGALTAYVARTWFSTRWAATCSTARPAARARAARGAGQDRGGDRGGAGPDVVARAGLPPGQVAPARLNRRGARR